MRQFIVLLALLLCIVNVEAHGHERSKSSRGMRGGFRPPPPPPQFMIKFTHHPAPVQQKSVEEMKKMKMMKKEEKEDCKKSYYEVCSTKDKFECCVKKNWGKFSDYCQEVFKKKMKMMEKEGKHDKHDKHDDHDDHLKGALSIVEHLREKTHDVVKKIWGSLSSSFHKSHDGFHKYHDEDNFYSHKKDKKGHKKHHKRRRAQFVVGAACGLSFLSILALLVVRRRRRRRRRRANLQVAVEREIIIGEVIDTKTGNGEPVLAKVVTLV